MKKIKNNEKIEIKGKNEYDRVIEIGKLSMKINSSFENNKKIKNK